MGASTQKQRPPTAPTVEGAKSCNPDVLSLSHHSQHVNALESLLSDLHTRRNRQRALLLDSQDELDALELYGLPQFRGRALRLQEARQHRLERTEAQCSALVVVLGMMTPRRKDDGVFQQECAILRELDAVQAQLQPIIDTLSVAAPDAWEHFAHLQQRQAHLHQHLHRLARE